MSALGRNGLRLVASALTKNNRAPVIIGSRAIASKARRGEVERPKPFPQETKDYNILSAIFDRTTKRMDENTRVILVDGAHAVGKTELAKQLAEEFGMKYMPFPRMSDYYINYWGDDLNDYAVYINDAFKPYDERDFSRNPTGPVEGAGDKYHLLVWMEKFRNYVYALKHLYNTGQGVVVEGDPWSDYAHLDAALNQRWIDRTTQKAIKTCYRQGLHFLLRPHVVLYLDAPVETVMKNIKERNNPWDKDSPVWTNKRYLNDIYNEKKRRYLMETQRHSHVLVYDWTNKGDVDVIVDDIEHLECDWTDEYDDLMRDWTVNRSEKRSMLMRELYCNRLYRQNMLFAMMDNEDFFETPQLFYDPHDFNQLLDVLKNIRSERYAPGYNVHMGDSNFKLMFTKLDSWDAIENLPEFCKHPRSQRNYFNTGVQDLPWAGRTEWLEPVKAEK